MTSFVRTDFPQHHAGVARVEAALASASRLSQGFDGTRGLTALLLAAVVSALLVVAERLVDTGDGLLAAWVMLWVVAFAALALFGVPARRLAVRLVKDLDDWSASIAQARADQRLWATARSDARVMADLQAAIARNDVAAPRLAAASAAPVRRVSLRELMAGWQRDVARARADIEMLRASDADHRVMADLQAIAGRAEAVPEVTKTLLRADQTAALRDAAHTLGARRSYYF
jgi:hypothetical protein